MLYSSLPDSPTLLLPITKTHDLHVGFGAESAGLLITLELAGGLSSISVTCHAPSMHQRRLAQVVVKMGPEIGLCQLAGLNGGLKPISHMVLA